MIDQQTNPGEEHQEEIIPAQEKRLIEEVEKIAKQDPDEAVHLNAPSLTEQNILHDADDAVHKTVSPTVGAEDFNKNIDPDDAVHGQG